MIRFEDMTKAISIIMLLSLVIPLLSTAYPHLNKFMMLGNVFLMPLSMFTSIFIVDLDLQHLVTCLMRFQLLYSIEGISKNDVELLFYTTLFVFPLLVSYALEGLISFNSSINMAYVYMLSKNQSNFNVFGFNVSNHTLPYLYLCIDFILSNGRTKAYYGLLYGIIYFKLKKHGLVVPRWFSDAYYNFCNRLNQKSAFRGKGRKIKG